ncbi:MAG: Hsp70 family protein, partial [Alphaproteobacteria bacterium]|nr:Hsp70 family protein [Alphaproteobacteria bacterium]
MVPDLRISDLAQNDITYIGIDFGTSTTVVSIASFDYDTKKLIVKPVMIEQILEDGTHFKSEKVPTVLAWYNQTLLVGEGAAHLKYSLHRGKNIWYSFKMEIGEDLGVKYYDSELGAMDGVKIRNPKDCVRMFFMYLKAQIEKYCTEQGLSKKIKYAVSIPASFEANQRKELLEALETNGMILSKQSLIDEPNAAFISYVHESFIADNPLRISPHYNSKVLVFDFGAGTCDISILEIGKNATGIYSKNISISQFTELGGDDVDRYITFHYILPRFFAYNDVKSTDFLTKERQAIATQLYKISEQLKILTCERIILRTDDFEIPDDLKTVDKETKVTVPIEITTTKGTLKQENFFLRYSELADTMGVFTKRGSKNKFIKFFQKICTTIKGENEYNSIFSNIESALLKANITADDIDYLLFIGGSAKNPYIQEAVKNYFSESKMLLPSDLQTHV